MEVSLEAFDLVLGQFGLGGEAIGLGQLARGELTLAALVFLGLRALCAIPEIRLSERCVSRNTSLRVANMIDLTELRLHGSLQDEAFDTTQGRGFVDDENTALMNNLNQHSTIGWGGELNHAGTWYRTIVTANKA